MDTKPELQMLEEMKKKAPLVGAMRTAPMQRLPVDEHRLAEAVELLTEYKKGKANLEKRVIEDEQWWEGRHWEVIRRKHCPDDPEPSSAWLFNAISNKHADAMDNYPEPVVLPREQSDDEAARTLSSVLPVVLEYNDFEQTYSDNWWEKLKHGTAVYSIVWDSNKDNGLGDISITSVDLLRIFWEPGIADIQDSRNLFVVELVDEEVLDARYPEHKGKLGGQTVDVAQYIYDDTVDTSKQSVVVDWYYKTQVNGKTVLHYAKFVGTTLLFASENEPERFPNGWYDHGMYPFVFDSLYPEKGTPVGFGYVAICKDPQMYIDKLSGNILKSSMMATTKRYFVSRSTDMNVDEFLDWTKPVVEVTGELDERRIREIEVSPISGTYLDVMQLKIEEMKETASNRDVNSGSAGSGVTAAAAIAALQEAGNKASRDMISASYRAQMKISAMCIELMRQFYDEMRSFRVTAPNGEYEFKEFSNKTITDQPIGADSMGELIYRKPIFDLKIKAQKRSIYSRMEQNERAKELYGMGFFSPERAQEATLALEMMDFEGIEKIREQVQQGQTLLNICQQMSQQMDQMALIIQQLTGRPMNIAAQGGTSPAPAVMTASTGIADKVVESQTPMTGYGEALAARSVPDMASDNSKVMPGGAV